MTHEKLNMETPGIARENSKVREEGRSLIREFDGVVSTFDRVLQFKEGNRFSLLTKIDELKKNRQDHEKQIQTLIGNIAIYNENAARIILAKDQLDKREKLVKANYEKMLAGSLMPEEIESLKSERLPGQNRVALEIKKKFSSQHKELSGLDSLITRKKEYIENLDHVFKKFDENLLQIDRMRKNLIDAHTGIHQKEEKAINVKAALASNSKSLQKKQEELEKELEMSIEEENFVLQEYRTVIKSVSSNIEITQKLDELLFSLLTAAEDKERSTIGDADNKFRPKILGKTG